MQRLINLEHHFDDYECMWNGIEDMYMNVTKEKFPDKFFFVLSGFGTFCYMKTPKAELKRMVALGDGRTKKMYEFLAPIAGFEYKHYSYKNFDSVLKKAKKEIDNGYPIVLGALDMYYLPYLKKIYHAEHIPFHYILMVGYDDDKQCIYIHDCGRQKVVSMPYEELKLAMNCSYPGLSKANTVCTIRIKKTIPKEQIAKEALKIRIDQFLNPPRDFLGYKGFEKFIVELTQWKEELGKEDYDKILANMVEFFGTVPTVPNAIKGINEPDFVEFKGGFDRMSRVLKIMGDEINNAKWISASKIFEEGADVVSDISNIIIEYLAGKEDRTDMLPELFNKVLAIMIDGYKTLETKLQIEE